MDETNLNHSIHLSIQLSHLDVIARKHFTIALTVLTVHTKAVQLNATLFPKI